MTQPLIALPDDARIATITMTLGYTTGIDASPFTKAEKSFQWPGQAWQADITIPPFNDRATASAWIAFGARLQGKWGRFYMPAPGFHRAPRGRPLGMPVVDGAGQTGTSLATRGWTPNAAGVLLAGDFIQIGTGISARLKMVTADVDADASGQAVIEIAPGIGSIPADGDGIVTDNPKGVFRLSEDSWSWSQAPGPVYRLSFSAVEVVNA